MKVEEKSLKIGIKEMTCCKCKKKFVSELDKKGIPYNRLCTKCNAENREIINSNSQAVKGKIIW